MTEEQTPVEKPKQTPAEKPVAVDVKGFMSNPNNFAALQAVAKQYGRKVNKVGSKIEHNIPSDQLPAMIALAGGK